MTTTQKLLTSKKSAQLFERLAQVINPEPELKYTTHLDLLIAVVLSAQTTDKQVNKTTDKLWQHCRTPEDYLALGEEKLAEHIRTIGLYRNKAKSIIGLCQKLLDDFHGQVPDTMEALTSLPGVGRKTANVVLNIAFGKETLAVDTHVFRVANRTGLVNEPTPEKTELALLPKVPACYKRDAHHYLILHGRYQCTARNPKCKTCAIKDICLYKEKEL